MGKNKGKGAANLRRINLQKKIDRDLDKFCQQFAYKIPSISFSYPIKYNSIIDEAIKNTIKDINNE